ncbi:MAG: biopolymer transporter TolR [Leptospira sp.]|nr:biopolymer transporter TolR [Leptospira sp.]
MKRFRFFLFIFFFAFQCAILQKPAKELGVNFDYSAISKNYFYSNQSKPFPLTVQKGNNLHNSTTKDGRYLFYATDQKGNFDIWFRDLKSSIVVPVTNHPYSQTKPAISPDGTKLIFVSEEYDSEGDLVYLEMDLEEWKSELLKGNRFINDNFQNITNPNFKKENSKQSILDTDPVWSPNGEYIVYVTTRFTPGLPNLCKMDPKNPSNITLLTKNGGVSPSFSQNGQSIYFLSYSDDEKGEIHKLDQQTGQIDRITKNEYLDYSPTVDRTERFLYYTSIRKDTNKNGRLDERDNSLLVLKNLQTGEERLLSSGETSNFDTRYSNFNGGSLLFSASYYNSINIYFIPENGSIPKQETISDQFEYAKSFDANKSIETYFLALDSIELFFGGDPLFPIYSAKAQILKSQALTRIGKRDESTKILRNLKGLKETPDSRFGIYIGNFEESKNSKGKFDLESYINANLNKEWSKDSIPSLYHLLADELELNRNNLKSYEILKTISRLYPDYHKISEVNRRVGSFEFNPNSESFPIMYEEMTKAWWDARDRFEKNTKQPFPNEKKRDLRYLLEDVLQKISEGKNSGEILTRIDTLLTKPSNQTNPIFKMTALYIKAKAYSDQRMFNESNEVLDSIIPIPTNIDLEPPGQPSVFEFPKFMADYKNPILLRANLLKYQNQKLLGNTSDALRNLKIYLEFYDPLLGVDLNSEEIQNAFFYFENKAIEFERIGDLLQSSFHYFFNNQNMFLVKTRNLYLDSLYKEYAVYYQRKMVDTIFSYGKKIREDEERALFNQLNILGKDKLNVVGNISGVTGLLTNSELFRGVIDVKDFEKIEVLSEKALGWTELYYKQAVPRARPYLDLATLYGYAYFLINKYVIYENYYNSTDTMTDSRKKEILENYKRAELELRWIIYADPTYYDAYQLLGWLYQYVDLRKQRIDPRANKTEIELYEVLYKKYFPDKNLEENIELYSQILTFLGEDYPDKKVISDLNLNLGNNYFLLNNYPKSNESYEVVSVASNSLLPKNQFESYKQEAVYRFNFARSLIYQGKFKDAVVQFDKAIEIYFNQEYFQAINANATDQNIITQKAVDEVRAKLALLFALKGFSELEDGNFANSAASFQTAIAYNKDVKFINPISLYNYLGIAFQKNGRFRDSYSMLDKAEEDYKNLSFSLSDTIKSWSFWNVILKDNLRVMGEGRFPGEFPDDFKFLLTLGVRIENHIEQKEFDFALREIEERNKFIKNKSLDETVMGRNILAKSKQVEAQIHFQNGNTLESIRKFRELILILLKEKQDKGLERLFQSLSRSVFVAIESGDIELKERLEIGLDFKNLMEEWKSLNNADCRNTKEECDIEFRKKYVQYDIITGTLMFYLSEVYNSLNRYEESQKHLVLAVEYLENPGLVDPKIIGLPADPISKKNRIRILTNLYSIYSKLGDKQFAEKKWKEAFELAYEFRMEEELFWLKSQKFRQELESDLYLVSKNHQILGRDAYNSFKNNLSLRLFTNRERVRKLLSDISFVFLENNETFEVVNLWEDFRKLELYRDVLGAQFEFEDTKLNYAYRDLLSWQKSYRRLIDTIAERGLRRESISKLEIQKDQEEKKFSTLVRSVQTSHPEKDMFFQPVFVENLKFQSGWLGIYRFRNSLYSFSSPLDKEAIKQCNLEQIEISCLANPNSGVKEIQILGNDFDGKTIRRVLGAYRKIFDGASLIFDRENQKLFTERNERNLKWITSFGNQKTARKSDSIRYVENSNLGVLLFETDFLVSIRKFSGLGSLFADKSSEIIPLREIFSSAGSEISLVGLPIENFETRAQWNQLSKIFEVVRSKRIQNLTSISASHDLTALNSKLSLTSFAKAQDQFFFGSYLSEFGSNKVNLSQKVNELQKLGFEKEKTKELPEAYEHYYTLSTLLPNDHPDLPNLELKMAKIKSEIFPSVQRLHFFEPLWNKYSNTVYSNLIRYEFLVSCYSSKEFENCDNYNRDFSSDSRELFQSGIQFYKKLRLGEVKDLSKWNTERMKIEGKEDPFIQAQRIGSLYIQNYMFDEAEQELQKLRALAKTPKEKNVVKNRELEILFHKGFLIGDEGIYSTSLTSTSAYSYGFRRDWDQYDEKILSREFTKFGYADSIYDAYRLNLYASWKNLIQYGYIEPLLLTPEFLTTGDSVLTKLSHLNRSLLFHMLSSSLQFQKANEVNSLIELLIQEESKEGRNLRRLAFRLVQARELLLRGDQEQAESILLNFESEYQKLGMGNGYLNKLYQKIKLKSLYLSDKPIPDSVKLGILEGFDLAKKSPPNVYLKILNDTTKRMKNQILSPELKTDFEFLFSYLMKLSLKNNSSEIFFDIAVNRDLFRYTSERFTGKRVFIKDLPEFIPLSESLKQKMVGNQELNAVFDLGKKSYLLSFSGGKSLGRELFADNREIFKEIQRYHGSILRGGTETLLRESISDRYRTTLRLNKSKRHYIYLHGLHELIPLQLPDTEYYYVASISNLITNPSVKRPAFTIKSFSPVYVNADQNEKTKVESKLIQWELGDVKAGGSNITIDFSPIEFSKTEFQIAGEPISSLQLKTKRSNSVYTNQNFGLKYLLDFSPVSYYLSKENSGFFVFQSGAQNGIHNLFFMRKFLEESALPKPVHIRLLEGKEVARQQAVDDRYWTGYRLFTNAIVED